MAVWSAVPISALEYSRIDADFYHPTYLNELEFWRRLEQSVGASKLGRLIAVPIRTGRTPKSRSIKGDEKCIRFIKTDTVREGSVDFNNSALLPARVVGERDIIPADAVVMTIIGATPEIVGRVAIVRPDDPECVTNQNVAVISTNGMCDPYFLTAYFQTKWGRDQVWRHSRRTEQVNLNCREVERILVPNPAAGSQNAIGDFVREAFAASDRSVVLYQQAQQLLEAELGLVRLTFQKPVGYTARFSDLETSHRSDAEFYNPELRFFWTELSKKFELRRLPDFAGVAKFANPSAKLCTNDLLFYSVGAYLGKTNIWLNNNEAVPASFITLLRCHDENDAGFLHALLNSRYGLLQSKCFQSGTSQQYIYSKDIRRFLVPDVRSKLRKQIHALVLESFAKERESKQLLERAKARVEQLIEEAVQP